MRKIYFVALVYLPLFLMAQYSGRVGINTVAPQSTLDINGNLAIREVSEILNLLPEDKVLLRDTSPGGEYLVKEISASKLFPGSTFTATALYLVKNKNLKLLNADLLTGGWVKIPLQPADAKVGDGNLITRGIYAVPQGGLYAVSLEYQLEGGLDLGLLLGKKLGIFKNGDLWDDKAFDAVRVSILAEVPITSTTLTTWVRADAGDTLTLAVQTGGLLNLGVLEDGRVSARIVKFAD